MHELIALRNVSKEWWVWNIESRPQKVESLRHVAGEELNIDPTLGSQSLRLAGILPNWLNIQARVFPSVPLIVQLAIVSPKFAFS